MKNIYDVSIPGLGETTVESDADLSDQEVEALAYKKLMPSPDAKTGELSSAGLSFVNSLKATAAYMTTTDPNALQDIVVSSIKGAVPGKDKEGNPYVVIEGKPFYLNKPGLSNSDAAGFVGDLIKYAPVTKVANMFQNGVSRVLAAAGGTGVISGISELFSKAMGSKQPFDAEKVGLDAVFGGVGQKVGDVLQSFAQSRRPITDSAGNLTKEFQSALKSSNINLDEFGEAGRDAIFDAYRQLGRQFSRQAGDIVASARQAEGDVFNIPLTRGQATGDVRQIAREEAMRQGGRGGAAQEKMLDFQRKQQEAIDRAAKERVGPTIAPRVGLFPGQQEAGGGMLNLIKRAAEQGKSAASAEYEKLNLQDVRLATKAFGGLYSRARKAIDDADIIASPELTPKTAQIFGQIETIVPETGKAEITEVSLKQIEKVRRQVSNLAKDAAPGSSDAKAAREVIGAFDSWLDDAIQTGLAKGDPEQLETLKKARSLWSNYKQSFGPPTGAAAKGPDADARRVVSKMVSGDLSPTESMNLLFGVAKLGDNQTAMRVAKRLKTVFGEDTPEFESFRSAAFSRLFQDTQGNTKSPQRIVSEIDELIMGRGSAVAQEIFTKDQIAKLRDFRSSVSRTLTPAEATNPSKTGYEISRALGDLIRNFGLMGGASSAVSGDIGGMAVSGTALGASRLRQAFDAGRATQRVPIPSVRSEFAVPVSVGFGGLLSPNENR